MLALGLALTSVAALAQEPPPPPVDRAETNTASDIRPLRIGAVILSGSLNVDAIKVNEDDRDQFRDKFRLRRARIGLAGHLTPNVGWNASAELTATPVLRNAFVQVRFSPYVSVRIGQSTPPSSIERGTSPIALELIDRSRITSQLTYAPEIGATLFNERRLAHLIGYAVSIVNGAGFDRSDDNDAKDVVGHLEIVPPRLHHAAFVVSGAGGEQPRGLRTRASAGVLVDARRVKLSAEALREHDEHVAPREGFIVTGVYRIRPSHVRPNFRMVELAARFFTFDDPLSAQGIPSGGDNAAATTPGYVPMTTREVQTGGSYYASRNVRVMLNLIVPADERTSPGTTIVSRFQVVF